MSTFCNRTGTLSSILMLGLFNCTTHQKSLEIQRIPDVKPRNVIFILSDDHRYDFMGFTGKVPWLETPNMDRLRNMGSLCSNAFVSTALSSPSRASILTGQYAHTHRIVDNTAPEPADNIYFPQYLRQAGYQTGFFGKWHMGDENDNPRRGFDRWVSFRGQGTYYNCEFNVDGKRVMPSPGDYTTHVLTDYALDFLKSRDLSKPFFVYLSHKAVHADFQPAPEDSGMYSDKPVLYPESYYLTSGDEYKAHAIPQWVKDQRYSWHGVDYMYHGAIGFEDFFRRYCETLRGVDESLGRVLDYLESEGLLESTLVIYMGDNGFMFGEHGLIDKRCSYEPSMRIPLLVACPELIPAGTETPGMVQNIDIAPTVLEAAGLRTPESMQGMSFLSLLKQDSIAWRNRIFYEYFWEYYFPQTPTTYAVRTDRYKFVYHPGIWDSNEFYDLRTDPGEMENRIADPDYQLMIGQLRDELFDWLESTGGMNIPIKRLEGVRIDHRYKGQY